MKKVLIGMAAGAMALGASVVPVSAGYGGENLWDGISESYCDQSNTDGDIFEALVLTAGWAERLDTDGNGDPRYTVFQPLEGILAGLLEALGLEVSDLNSQPSVVSAILADHIANGSFSEAELEDTDLKRITMRSGFVAPIVGAGDSSGGPRTYGSSLSIATAPFLVGFQLGNGWLHCIAGFIDSTPLVPHEGLNSQDTPQDGTPGGTNSLPDTL